MSIYANSKNKYFTKTEAIESIKDVVVWYDGYGCDLHNEVFNTDYYVIDSFMARKALEEYDVFEALEVIQDYEKNLFGEITTDISYPTNVANMLWYIIGEEVINRLDSLQECWNRIITEEDRKAILAELEAMEGN